MEDNAPAKSGFEPTAIDNHLGNLRQQLEDETPEGGNLEIRNIVTVVETAEQDAEGETTVGVLTRFRGVAPAALGLLSLADNQIRQSLNETALDLDADNG